ncbi:glycosyltransferase [Larsenimonas rhizosphaerae]|uniref:Glycosyltransferase n=1 Tax=Larsenimonas rhizosphaerae TaxID=2944682 RepID=A0AA42CY85_9GAMM|nr:glycosyltransferase [Larsenimonas rhizosphaerae]MCX2524840.1 glycosyltransferase [Larsenimonas rhizosphaerae]
MTDSLRVACIVPTRNGGDDIKALLASLAIQKQPFDLYIVDSSSEDDSRLAARAAGAEVTEINVETFDHGGTRQRMVDTLEQYDICTFLTQDVVLADALALERLVDAFDDHQVGAAYGRQLPRADATPFAAFLRDFNYPGVSRRQSLASIPSLGMKTVFISNSFAAYRRQALQQVGGFPDGIILGEDAWAAALLVQAGWVVSYVANSECIHSHNYSISQEWRRYFDIGVFHGRAPWILERFGTASGEGKRFVIEELKYLGKSNKALWALSVVRNVGKLVFYKLGQQEKRLPNWLKRRLSMHRRFWDKS